MGSKRPSRESAYSAARIDCSEINDFMAALDYYIINFDRTQ
jgi:hypothetical protein